MGALYAGWVSSTTMPSKNYVIFRKRVLMDSVATLRTFEMILAVSLTRWNSRLKPKENVVLIFTIA